MKIILEAPDRCGKTSLYNELASHWKLFKIGSISGETVSIDQKDKYMYYRGVTDSYISSLNANDDCIKDRCFISTVVYNIVYSRRTFEEGVKDFNRYLNDFNSTKHPILITIKSDYTTYCDRVEKSRIHYRDDTPLIPESVYKLTEFLFDLFAKKSESKFKVFTLVNDNSISYDDFIAEGMKKISSYMKDEYIRKF